MSIGLSILTLVHVIISLVGIASGFVVLGGFLKGYRLDRWNAVFLATTILTSATGFLFPFTRVLPSHVAGIVSLVVLAAALFARYRRQLAGWWQPGYVITSMIALHLNVFVLVAQLFQKVPSLRELAPTQTELPFAITQGVVLLLFGGLTVIAVSRFRPDRAGTGAKTARIGSVGEESGAMSTPHA